jgi:hypothetical protein
MNYIFKTDQSFDALWEEFIIKNSNASWLYLLKNTLAGIHYGADKITSEQSFIIVVDNKPVCICPMFLVKLNGDDFFMKIGWGGYMPAPLVSQNLDAKFKEKVQKSCFEKIDELAKQFQVKKVMLLVDPLSENNSFNYLLKYDYLDSSTNTSYVDLTQTENQIWTSLRKSYKSLINNGKKKFDVVIVDKENADFDIHELYRELHHKAAGRVTRSKETWDLQFDMLTDDNAILIGLKDGDRFVAFSYFFHQNGTIYYGSSSEDPDYETIIPLEHNIIWHAIIYYKNRGFKYLEIGHQQFGQQIFDHPSTKEINLAFFKRGFGGNIKTIYRGIKYYDADCMKKELLENVNEFLSVSQKSNKPLNE